MVGISNVANSQALLNNSSLGTSSNYIKILAGSDMKFDYVAGDESGEVINTGYNATGKDSTGSISFNAIGRTGNWSIYSDSTNDYVATSNGNNTVNVGLGNNTIVIGTGRNTVFSEGKDTITGSGGGYQSITLTGSQANVNLATDQTLLTDIGDSNVISVGDI